MFPQRSKLVAVRHDCVSTTSERRVDAAVLCTKGSVGMRTMHMFESRICQFPRASTNGVMTIVPQWKEITRVRGTRSSKTKGHLRQAVIQLAEGMTRDKTLTRTLKHATIESAKVSDARQDNDPENTPSNACMEFVARK